ncbi:MAG: Na-translocating system protein MpsB [Gammaproteobacteria bacterium]
MHKLLQGVTLAPAEAREKRPFAQALFCIDTRSERIRRQLEGIGDYQTFGIAGFFGVPVNFLELGKGSEMHLCPVILTPKNVVLEMSMQEGGEPATLSSLEKALHALKESVLTPFVTVEAIGLLFGFDMFGKTLAPRAYNRWRYRMHPQKPVTRLLLEKLTREQGDSIVRAVQRAVIVKALEQELGLETERLTDELIRDLREAALGHSERYLSHTRTLGISEARLEQFIEHLRSGYRINPAFAQLQLEQLGRIGFTLDEQVRYVGQALKSIGLTKDFSRFILLVGHGSMSENNPYESALDCGACGGNHGLVSARVLAQMANKPEVRQRLRESGVQIPDDAWFVPALHNTTTDELSMYDLDMLPPSHLVYLDRLRKGLTAASRLCAQERLPSLQITHDSRNDPAAAQRDVQRNAMDWSQVRPEWGLSGNAYFIIGSRDLTRQLALDGRAFLHSYDYRVDRKRRLLENILTGPLVVGQWINMEHYFSAVDNERFGSGSKVYHNVAGRFGVMTGNLSDLRTGLPSQTVLESGKPFHQPLRLITVIEAPFEQARGAVEAVVSVKYLVRNGWIRLMIIDPETTDVFIYENGDWHRQTGAIGVSQANPQESRVS